MMNGFECGGMFIFPFMGFTVMLVVMYMMFVRRDVNKSSSSTSLNILKQRYAQGEIDKKTYEQMKADIA